MVKKFEVDWGLFCWCFSQEFSLLHKKFGYLSFTRHGVLLVKNKRFSFVFLFKEVKQLVRTGLCIEHSLG